jgi:hypothetical protein
MNHTDYFHLSGNIACQSWPMIGKFCTFKQLFFHWLNQVTTILAVPARILRIFSLQNPTPLRGFGEKKIIPPPPEKDYNKKQKIPVI